MCYPMGMPPDHQPLLRRAYAHFNAREIDAAVALMHPDVDWPNGFEGGREHGRAAVRAYWTRQFEQIDPEVEPTAFSTRPDGSIAVAVHQTVRDLAGATLVDGPVTHVWTVDDDGLVTRMEIEPG
jgi:hypothetical protein